MPRELGGYTDLGRQINSINSGTDFVKSRITSEPKIGRIKKAILIDGNEQYLVILEYVNKKTGKPYDSPPMILIDHPKLINSEHGLPSDLPLMNLYCEVTFTGPSSSRGKARIVRSLTEDSGDARKWGELDQQGAAFASPGSGFA